MTKPTRDALQTDQDTALEAAILRALEQPAQPAIPANFAAQVRASLPPQSRKRKSVSAGRAAAFLAATVLLAGVFVVAPHALPAFNNIAFDIELSLLVELAMVTCWLAKTPQCSIS